MEMSHPPFQVETLQPERGMFTDVYYKNGYVKNYVVYIG